MLLRHAGNTFLHGLWVEVTGVVTPEKFTNPEDW
jgi:hypothetical protein